MLFSAAITGALISVRSIDKDAGASVVPNYMQQERMRGGDRGHPQYTSSAIIVSQLKKFYSAHLRDGHPSITISDTDSSFQHISQYIETTAIAMTPRERFLEVEHSTSSLKLFSLRQRHSVNGPLTDFEQAVHDARRMGWLLHVPSTTGNGQNQLVLPTRWHGDYLEFMLTRKSVLLESKITNIDTYLDSVLHYYRASVILEAIKTPEGLQEKTVDAEFMRGSEEHTGDPCFALPQVHTNDNLGIIDFIIPSKRWLIELMVEGNDVPGHLKRFQRDQSYGRQWPEWEWRVIDFRFKIKPRKNCKSYLHAFNAHLLMKFLFRWRGSLAHGYLCPQPPERHNRPDLLS